MVLLGLAIMSLAYIYWTTLASDEVFEHDIVTNVFWTVQLRMIPLGVGFMVVGAVSLVFDRGKRPFRLRTLLTTLTVCSCACGVWYGIQGRFDSDQVMSWSQIVIAAPAPPLAGSLFLHGWIDGDWLFHCFNIEVVVWPLSWQLILIPFMIRRRADDARFGDCPALYRHAEIAASSDESNPRSVTGG